MSTAMLTNIQKLFLYYFLYLTKTFVVGMLYNGNLLCYVCEILDITTDSK